MAVVVFDVEDFRTIYPQFSELTDAQLTAFFEDACLYLDNTDASPVQNITLRTSLLYKIVCHLATLAQRGGGVTGAVTSASEGSVSSSFSPLQSTSENAAWWNQTACGAAFWMLWRRFTRGGYYVPYTRYH